MKGFRERNWEDSHRTKGEDGRGTPSQADFGRVDRVSSLQMTKNLFVLLTGRVDSNFECKQNRLKEEVL